jgi:periplasmic protein TonB
MHGGTSLARAFSAGVEDRQLRLLWAAVLASLALHALILFLLPYFKEYRQSRAALPSLTAHLAKPVPPKPAPPEPQKAEPPLIRPAAKPQARPVTAPVPPTPTPVLSVEPSKQAAEPALTVPVAPAQPVARVAPAPAASGPDPGTIARFRLELMEIARRYKRYPRIAQDNNWEGRVELRIAFAESGAISSMTVKKGTGRAVLDEEAQAMIRSAHPLATLPPALRGKAFTLEIPVDFSLRDER